MKKKAIVLALALSAGVFVGAAIIEAGQRTNGAHFNGIIDNGIIENSVFFSETGLDFTTISHQGLGK